MKEKTAKRCITMSWLFLIIGLLGYFGDNHPTTVFGVAGMMLFLTILVGSWMWTIMEGGMR